MKYKNFLVLVLIFLFTISMESSLFAQDDEEITPEEWSKQMDELTAKKNELQAEIISLYAEADSLNKIIADKEVLYEKESEKIYWWIGSSASGVAEFRKMFESTENIINNKLESKEAMLEKFKKIDSSRIKCLPEFWDRYQIMKKKTETWDN